ncbi:alpha/beta fold hydrolase [Sandaracinobacter sp.]|uniref:alpha/beta fold hydrolase n=1 Tax=Sandaracinobacter sp. TaxID=2487581 RepID=UPI0035B32F46
MTGAVTRRYRTADGIELVGDDGGDRAAPAVVLLHGGGQTRHSWAGTMQLLLDRGYRVLNFDARGHGDSGWSATGAYHLDDRAADLAEVVRDCTAGFALVGASLGGATSLHAVASGLAARAVVLVDIVPDPEPAGIARIVNFMRAHAGGFATLEDAVDAVAAYNPSRPRPSDPSGLMRNLRTRADGRLYWHWDPLTVSGRHDRFHDVVRQSAAVVADLTHLPLLLVRGLSSDVVSDAGVAAFRAQIPRLEVVDIGGAGHMVAGDRNDAFGQGVIDFLARHLPLKSIDIRLSAN